MNYEDVYFVTQDGVRIHGWWIPAPRGGPTNPPTILFCHENAGNIGLRIPEYIKVHQELKVNQFVFDYRGYGNSAGVPGEEGMILDSLAAFNWLQVDQMPKSPPLSL